MDKAVGRKRAGFMQQTAARCGVRCEQDVGKWTLLASYFALSAASFSGELFVPSMRTDTVRPASPIGPSVNAEVASAKIRTRRTRSMIVLPKL